MKNSNLAKQNSVTNYTNNTRNCNERSNLSKRGNHLQAQAGWEVQHKPTSLQQAAHNLKFIIIFSVVFSSISQLFAQSGSAPIVQWRRFDWPKQNPNILGSAASLLQNNRSNSGSDWWYDIKNSFSAGSNSWGMPIDGDLNSHNGYILSGYSTIPGYDDAEQDGCKQGTAVSNTNPINCQFFEEGNDPKAASWYHTIGKVSANGGTLEWLHFLPFNGNGYKVLQLMDGSYLVIGDSFSTRKFDGSPIYYNPTSSAPNEYFCDGTTSHDIDDVGGNNIKPNFIGISHVTPQGVEDWAYNYGYYGFSDIEIKTALHDAWDLVQTPTGRIFVIGKVSNNVVTSLNESLIIEIGANGYLLSKNLLHVDDLNSNEAQTRSWGKSITCRSVSGVEK